MDRRAKALMELGRTPEAADILRALVVSPEASPEVQRALDEAETLIERPSGFDTLYLPMFLREEPILVKQGGGRWLLDNSTLKSKAAGVVYRKSTVMDDRTTQTATFGSIVHGVEVNGWIQVRCPMEPSVEDRGSPTECTKRKEDPYYKKSWLGEYLPEDPMILPKKLLRQAEAEFEKESFSTAVQTCSGAVEYLEQVSHQTFTPIDPLIIEKPVLPSERKPDPITGKKEALALLSAYGQLVRCHLAAHGFKAAQEVCAKAVKLYRWEDERLDLEFCDTRGLKSSAKLVEMLQRVEKAAGASIAASQALQEDRFDAVDGLVTAPLASLQRQDWQAAGPLIAELSSLRSEAALRCGELDVATVDAERAFAFDTHCERARACLDELRRHCE